MNRKTHVSPLDSRNPPGSQGLPAGLALGLALFALLPARPALAQEDSPPTPATPPAPTPPQDSPPEPTNPPPEPTNPPPAATNPEPANPPPAPPRSAPQPAPPPPPAPAPQAPKEARTDHEQIVGAYGIGYIGATSLPLAFAVPVGRSDQAGVNPNDRVVVTRLAVPSIGARKWVSRRVAVDAGLGLWFSGGNENARLGSTSVNVDKQSVFAFVLHTALPIMVFDSKHMSLLVAPQVKFGWAGSNVAPLYEPNAPPDAELRGMRVEVGGKAGAELYFGFIGLPRLALEVGVGLNFTAELASAKVADQFVSETAMFLGAESFGNPWDIISTFGTLAARYYF